MEFLTQIERRVLEWTKGLAHLPKPARVWLGENVWWIVAVVVVISTIAALFTLVGLIGILSVVGTIAQAYYASSVFTTWALVTGLVGLVFSIAEVILMGMAVQPLKAKQKKGWVLLFATWLVGIVAVVVNSILTLNPLGFILGVIFGAIWSAVIGYFLFEIHGQFAHTENSRGSRKKTT